MTKNIFFGTSSRGTPTSRMQSEAITFLDLYKRIKKGVSSPVTNIKYWYGTPDQRKRWKSTEYFTSATFTGNMRNNKSIKSIHLIIIDIDKHESAARLLYMLHNTGVPSRLKHLDMFIYNTTSSRIDALRVRLVIDVLPFNKIYLGNVVDNIETLFDVEFDPVSKVPSQPMYLPLIFEDHETKCIFFPSENPTGLVRGFFEYEDKTPILEAGLSNLSKLPVVPYTCFSDKDICEAIIFLKVDYEDNERYEPRFRIAAAIKRQYINDDAKGREILELYAARWTINGSREKIFDYYNRLTDPTEGEAITILTLIAEAKINGWVQKHDWLSDFVFLRQAKNQYYNIKTKEAFNKNTFDSSYGYKFLDPDISWEKQRNDLASSYVTKIYRLPEYADVMFYPGAEKVFKLEDNGPKYLNTYVPIEINYPPNYEAKEKTLAIMEKHTADLVGDYKLEKLVMSFIANIVQNPAFPVSWALVIISVPGAGKSIFATWLLSIMGKHAKAPRWHDYMSNQSEYLLNTQFLLLDEIMPGKYNAVSLTESLKTIIEGKISKVRVMYRNTFEVPSRMNIILLSNSEKIITPKDDTRRYLYIKSPMTINEAKEKYKSGGFKDAYELAQRPCDIVAALLSYKIDKNFDLNAAHQTEAIERLRQDSHGNDAQIIQNFIDSGDYVGINVHIISTNHLREAYKGERERYISYRIDEALEELGYRKNRYKTKEGDTRLNIPKNDSVKRRKLTTHDNITSTEKEIYDSEELLKAHYRNLSPMSD